MTDLVGFPPPGDEPIDVPRKEPLDAEWLEERWKCPTHPDRYLDDKGGDEFTCPEDGQFLIKPED